MAARGGNSAFAGRLVGHITTIRNSRAAAPFISRGAALLRISQ